MPHRPGESRLSEIDLLFLELKLKSGTPSLSVGRINNIVTNLPSKQTMFIDEKGEEMAW